MTDAACVTKPRARGEPHERGLGTAREFALAAAPEIALEPLPEPVPPESASRRMPDPPPDASPPPAANVRFAGMPRERLRTAGPAALSDVELLVLLLGSGLPGHNVFDVARGLIDRFGSLRALLDAQPEEFTGLRGIGPAKCAKLLAVIELARRALAEKVRERPLVDSPRAVEDYLRLLIGGRAREVFVCLFLDVRHRLIRTEESSHGSLKQMTVYPREIVRRALLLNAANLIVAQTQCLSPTVPGGPHKPLMYKAFAHD